MNEENRGIDNGSNIDWSKFKSNAKGKEKERAEIGYIDFIKKTKEIGFSLISNYINTESIVKLISKEGIVLEIQPNNFKTQTYKNIINFNQILNSNGDKFIGFVGLSSNNKLIAKISTFDKGIVEINTSNYKQWAVGRKKFYNKLEEVGGEIQGFYKNAKSKNIISINGIKLNPITVDSFCRQVHKSIINFKNKLKENGDEFIKFVDLTKGNKLVAKIKTFDGVYVNINTRAYNSWDKGRKNTYEYCEEKRYRVLSPYIFDKEKMLIDFNCGHNPNWITPSNLKSGFGCPNCKISKGVKKIMEYLEKNNIEFKQEYRFDNCKHKRSLPFDFYIQEYNLCIEFDGKQHFEESNFFGGEESFKLTQKRDKIKNKYCKYNGINLLRIPYYEIDSIDKMLNEEFDRLRGSKEAC